MMAMDQLGSGQKLVGVNVATVFTPTRQQIRMVTTLMFIHSDALPACHVITANNETTD
jgi:hypothetical protein